VSDRVPVTLARDCKGHVLYSHSTVYCSWRFGDEKSVDKLNARLLFRFSMKVSNGRLQRTDAIGALREIGARDSSRVGARQGRMTRTARKIGERTRANQTVVRKHVFSTHLLVLQTVLKQSGFILLALESVGRFAPFWCTCACIYATLRPDSKESK
jgi:hypothetical protein